MQSNSQNFLADTVMRLARARAEGGVWREIVTLAREVGAEYVSIGQFSKNGYAPQWGRTSIEKEKTDEFFALGYHDFDPILLARKRGQIGVHGYLSLPTLLERPLPCETEEKCIRFDVGGGIVDSWSFRSVAPGGRGERMIAFIGGPSTTRALKSFGKVELAAFADLLAMNLSPPTPEDPGGKTWGMYRFLSEREKDALCFLASGLTNDQIAFRMGIAEVTVRMHLRNARQKMGAATREQALAMALDRGLVSL